MRDLRTYFKTDDGIVRAVDGVSFSVQSGQTLGVVGESGCGKSVTMLSILSLNSKPGRIDPAPSGAIAGTAMETYLKQSKKHLSLSTGQALFRGEDILRASNRRLREVRGSEISMIFQDPMTSLNPVLSVGDQLIEAVLLHQDVSPRQARKQAIEGLDEVGIPRAERRIDDYPHQFSGGMRQRVMIAMALINEPDLLIADEPTTALDVTTQAQILGLISELQKERGTAVVMITHDLGVVAEIADEVVVMYAARVAERAPVYELFDRPLHPYTWGLLGPCRGSRSRPSGSLRSAGSHRHSSTRRAAAASTPAAATPSSAACESCPRRRRRVSMPVTSTPASWTSRPSSTSRNGWSHR